MYCCVLRAARPRRPFWSDCQWEIRHQAQIRMHSHTWHRVERALDRSRKEAWFLSSALVSVLPLLAAPAIRYTYARVLPLLRGYH